MPDPKVEIGDAQMRQPQVSIGDAQITGQGGAGYSLDDIMRALGMQLGPDGSAQLVQNDYQSMPERYGMSQPGGVNIGQAEMRGQSQPSLDVVLGNARMRR